MMTEYFSTLSLFPPHPFHPHRDYSPIQLQLHPSSASFSLRSRLTSRTQKHTKKGVPACLGDENRAVKGSHGHLSAHRPSREVLPRSSASSPQPAALLPGGTPWNRPGTSLLLLRGISQPPKESDKKIPRSDKGLAWLEQSRLCNALLPGSGIRAGRCPLGREKLPLWL